MDVKYNSLCETTRAKLKREGYHYLSVHNVYDNAVSLSSPQTVMLMPHKRPPSHYLITLDQEDVAALLTNIEYNYCVISPGD